MIGAACGFWANPTKANTRTTNLKRGIMSGPSYDPERFALNIRVAPPIGAANIKTVIIVTETRTIVLNIRLLPSLWRALLTLPSFPFY
jgi:hypothetical protein